MSAKLMTVKDLTRKTGLPRETLRFYEAECLLRQPRRGSNGYRLFTDEHVERVEFIKKTKKAGFTIREIRELIALKDDGQANCRRGREIALDRIEKLDKQIASLQEVRGILEDFARRCEAEGLDQPCSLSFFVPTEIDEQFRAE